MMRDEKYKGKRDRRVTEEFITAITEDGNALELVRDKLLADADNACKTAKHAIQTDFNSCAIIRKGLKSPEGTLTHTLAAAMLIDLQNGQNPFERNPDPSTLPATAEEIARLATIKNRTVF